jgi:uncharacterized damage-inducible protein DinB
MATHQTAFCAEWKHVREQLERILYMLPAEKLSFSPHESIGTIGRQLRHVGDVAEVFIRGIETGVVDFKEKRRDRSMETSKEKLVHYIHQQTQSIHTFIKALPDPMLEALVQFPEIGMITVEQLLRKLIEHEYVYLGILYTSVRLAGVEVPEPYQQYN